MKIVSLWIPVCLAALVAGCGQKGPLVLPDAAPKHKKTLPSPRAPAPPPPAAPAPAGTAAPAATSNPADATPKP